MGGCALIGMSTCSLLAMEESPAVDVDVEKVEPEVKTGEDEARAAAAGEGEKMDTEEQTTGSLSLQTI